MALAEKIQKLRKEKELSQKALAKLVNVHYTHLGRYERGASSPPVDVIKKLAKIFGVSTDYLLFNSEDEVAATKIIDKDLLEQFEKVSHLDDKDKEAVKTMIEGILIKNQLGEMVKGKK